MNNFNDEIANLRESCTWLFRFEKDRNLSLKLNSCSSYSDGGGRCRSKYISANQRLKAENPRLLDFWCAPHGSHKVVEHASKTTDFGKRHLTTSAQVQKLFTASAELPKILRDTQETTGETTQFRSKKPIHLKDFIMHKWESLKDALDAQVKIPLSIVYAVAQLKHDAERGRVKQNIRDKAMGIYNKLRDPAYVLYQHMQLDIADIMVDFIRCVEGCDVDLAMYLHYVELTKLKLKSLKRQEGVYYKIGKSHFLPGGKLAEDNDFPQPKGDLKEFFQDMDVHKNAVVQAFLDYMEECHPSDVAENLKGFLLFD